MQSQPPKSLEEIEAERRRQRWGYFWTPFITLTSVVTSIAMLMFLLKSCDERGLPRLLLPATSPLHGQGAATTPPLQSDDRTDGHESSSAPSPQGTTENQSERTSPAP